MFGTNRDSLETVVRQHSPFGHLKGWKLAHFIVKAGDDCRMEALAMQVTRVAVGGRRWAPAVLTKVVNSDLTMPCGIS